MTDPKKSAPPANVDDGSNEKMPRPWPKRIGIGLGAAVVLLFLVYMGVGSAFFVRSFVLPAVEEAMVAKVSVGKIAFSPFKGIELEDLDFTPADQETMVSAKRASVQYSLGDIIGGTIKLNQLHLENPTVTIIEHEDGRSNLSDWLESLPPSSDEPLPIMDLNDLDVVSGKIIYRKVDANQSGDQIVMELPKARVSRLGQDLSGSVDLQSLIQLVKLDGPSEEQEIVLSTKLSLNGDLSLNKTLLPKQTSLNGAVDVESVSSAYADLIGVGGTIDVTLQPESIDKATIDFSKNGQTAGNIHLTGPMNFETLEGNLQLTLSDLNRQFLNLAGAIAGLDFKDTVVDGTMSCALTNGGSHIAVSATANAKNLSVQVDELELPAMNTELKLVGHYDAERESAVIRECHISASHENQSWLEGSIDKPITLSWGSDSESFQTSKFQLAIKQMDLNPWKPFLGDVVKQGELNGELDVEFLQQGRHIKASGVSVLSKAGFLLGDQSLDNNRIEMQGTFTFQDFNRVVLDQGFIEWKNSSEELLVSTAGSGSYQLNGKGFHVELDVAGDLSLLHPVLPVEGLRVDAGSGSLTARVQQRDGEWSGAVQTSLADYTGNFAGFQFNDYTVNLESEVGIRDQKFNLGNSQLEFQEGFNEGGSLGFSGDLDLSTKQGKFKIQSSNVNHYALQPFLVAFADKENLNEVGLNFEGELDLNLVADSSFRGTAALNNLSLENAEDESKQKLKTEFEWDLGWNVDQFDIRNGTLKLSPTAKAGNTLKISGQLPVKPSIASKGAISIESASMDLTSYMDLFMASAEQETESTDDDVSTPEESASDPETPEPSPLDIPLGELDAHIDIGKLFARDLAIQGIKGRMLWQTNTLHLEPVSMNVNDGPVQASMHMDFSKPDWEYQMQFDAQNIPVQALTDTLDPANKGKVSGLFSTTGDWKGKGLMEPALQRNLSGSMSLNYSEANIELVSPTVRLLMTPITALLRLPELMKAPITGMETAIAVQDQTLTLQDTKVLSDAFQVHTSGEIPLANVLTNSVLNLPVEFHLERSIAKKSNLIPGSAPEDTPFVKLPDFVSLKGTIGKPETKTDKLVLSGLLMKSAAGLPLNVGEGAVNALKGVGNFLVGDSGKEKEEETSAEETEEGEDGEKEESSPGILKQVNPFKLFDQLRGDRKKTEEETSKEDP